MRKLILPTQKAQNPFKVKLLAVYVRIALVSGLVLESVAHAELPVPAKILTTMGKATAHIDGTRTQLRIDQRSDRAILNWQSFNVGAKNQVRFNQPNSSSIALNRIFQNDPSKILGKLSANGQVYLVNQNGFVFGKNARINTNTLVASALNISDDTFKKGLVREFDDTGNAALGGSTHAKAAIQIEKGAKIHVGKNGRLIMAAPTVSNKGDITTDEKGQIILVASKDKVYLQPADSNSPFAGLLVEVGSGGKVTNLGKLLARQGNITLAGFAVNQSGRATATTSVNVNGSIRLLARESAEKQSEVLVATKTTRPTDLKDGLGTRARVTFSKGSLTEVVADRKGGSAIDEQKQPTSYLEVSGHTIHLESNSKLRLPGGKIDMTATDDLLDPKQGTQGRILVDKKAHIDVSGMRNITASISRNVVEVPVQSFELRDSPDQRNGVLKGQTIRVDIRKDTKIVDTSGAIARYQRTIEERLGTGGNVNFSSSGDVIVNNEAKVNISGGSIKFQDGYVNTTKLVTDYGRIVDISNADPKERYVSVLSEGPGNFEKGYTEGKNAGSLSISAPNMQWGGELVAGATHSLYQRKPDKMPFGGSFTLDNTVFNSAQRVVFQAQKPKLELVIDDAFPKDSKGQPGSLVLNNALINKSGVQNLTVKTLGNMTLAADSHLSMTPNSQLKVEAGHLDVNGSVYSAGGSINLTTTTNALVDEPGKLTVAKGAILDVSGRWVNDFQKGLDFTPTEALAIDGGSVKITATGDLNLVTGSTIKADGGAWLSQNNALKEGVGGALSFAAIGNGGKPSLLHVDGKLSAYGLIENGSLSLSSGTITVGNTHVSDDTPTLALNISKGAFNFAPHQGFKDIHLTSNFGHLVLQNGTRLNLIGKNRVLQTDFLTAPSSASLAGISQLEVLPEYLRQPINLTLTARQNVQLESNTTILADKQATIHLDSAEQGVYVNGLISAPGGAINLSTQADPSVQYNSAQSLWLGSQARLLVTGTTRLNPLDALGRRTGDVLDGGVVNLTANRGYVILEQGSFIDVSGSKAKLDLPSQAGNGSNFHHVATEVGSNAGNISLTAAEGMLLDGSFKGLAGSSSTQKGQLTVSLDRQSRNEPPLEEQLPGKEFPINPMTLQIQQAQIKNLPAGLAFGAVIPSVFNGKATVSSDNIAKGGFGSLSFSSPDEVLFLGNVNLTSQTRLAIDAQKLSWQGLNGAAEGTVNLNTSYLRIGSSLQREVTSLPTLGGGVFNAKAQWIELGGASSWNGFREVHLTSSNDLRAIGIRTGDSQRDFIGTLVSAANLYLTAHQVYLSTLSNFTFAVKNNPEGKIIITGQNSGETPLSAGGVLSFEAPIIEQKGVIKAPFGVINLKATTHLLLDKGSVTSVSGAGQVIPFGITQGGLDWLYPLDSFRNLVFNAPPEKKLNLSAPKVTLAKGSVVDLSGGGDLLAYEFLPGSGGSNDYLQPGSPSYEGSFAVLPALGNRIAPFDHLQSNNFAWTPGSSVYLKGTDKLPAGEYTILPARYALLPGAFLVTPQADSQDQFTTTFTANGFPIVAGYHAISDTPIRDARWSGFRIEQGSDVRRHSEYDEQTANRFYTTQATKNELSVPLLPIDSGQVAIAAQNQLVLEGLFQAHNEKGRGARMDITADRLKIVKKLSATPTTGTLEVSANDLAKLNVDSLLLGGTRQNNTTTGNTDIDVTATDVIFDTGVKLTVKDIVAVAKNNVEVKEQATLQATAGKDNKVNTGDSTLNLVGDGALLRVSADKQVELNRTEAPGATGKMTIAQGALLTTSGSMLLDASHSTTLAGTIKMENGSLNLSANKINIGEVSRVNGDALNLSNEKLQNLNVNELILNSRDTINFYGNAIVGEKNNKGQFNFTNLVMNAAGFSGVNNSSTKIQADSLHLQNTLDQTSARTGTGSGSLELNTMHYRQGEGHFAIDGFNKVTVNATKSFIAEGQGVLQTLSDLTINSGVLSATGGSNLKIEASGHNLSVAAPKVTTVQEDIGFGAVVNMVADTINLAGNVVLPSGVLGLQALNGAVKVSGNTAIDLAGRTVKFADTVAYSAAGSFSATAKGDNGHISFLQGSQLNLSAAGAAPGGSFNLNADQSVSLLGNIKATGATARIDVAHFDKQQNFDALMDRLGQSGVSDGIYLRSREDSINQNVGHTIKANQITLIADKGSITLAGTLNASADKVGGTIKLAAGDNIALNRANLLAKGVSSNATGGQVQLSSVDSDKDNVSGISINTGSIIDVGGSTKTTGGDVTLRALRVDSNRDGRDDDIAIQPIKGIIRGASTVYAEGVKKYSNTDFATTGQITETDIAKIKQDTDAYMTPATLLHVSKKLGNAGRLKAGIEIDYNGDLALSTQWDFVDWRYSESPTLAGLPGTLTIKASGQLALNNSLSDGFKNGILPSGIEVTDLLQTGDSWSYQLTAGADVNSADVLATVADVGTATPKDLIIGDNTTVRTGTGDITLTAAHDIVFTSQTSTVYNAGRPEDQARYGSLSDQAVGFLFYSEYPVAGGDLTLTAGKDIKGAISTQFIDSWLVRQGSWTNNVTHASELATAWGVALGYTAGVGNVADSDAPLFQQNIGSFGGGRVNISAAGSITDLSVMMPMTGKQIGTPDKATFSDFLTNAVKIQGGGQMRVTAGGDIAGGAYFLGQGEGVLSAGGNIKGGTQFDKGPQLVMGDSQLALNANKNINIAAVSDAMMLHSGRKAVVGGADTNFFSYSDGSQLHVQSLSGDVHLGADISVIGSVEMLNLEGSQQRLANIYPASLQTTAFGGSVLVDNEITLFPSATSNLELLANQDISSGNLDSLRVGLSDADRALLPSALFPLAKNSLDEADTRLNPFGIPTLIHAAAPLHFNDPLPIRLITQAGDIHNIQFNLPKKAIVQSGRDLTNTLLSIQHTNQNDVSIVSAGRDIRYTSERSEDGSLAGNINKIEVAGPGDVLVKSGRHIDLGASIGLSTVGNVFNQNLPNGGANLHVLAGLKTGDVNYAGFLDVVQYANNYDKFKVLVTQFMRQRLGDPKLTEAIALTKFRQLKPSDYATLQPKLQVLESKTYAKQWAALKGLITQFMRQYSGDAALAENAALSAFSRLKTNDYLAIQGQLNALTNQVFFNELRESGSAAAKSNELGNERGFAAINAMFPGNQWQGDLNLFFSKLQTIQGGNIDLLVPGGQINAGLAVSFSGAKESSELGIVAQGRGDINAFVHDDFIVNQSRVFALSGGDITVWSSEGDIDAGRGAKSAIAAPPPIVSFNKDGNLVIEFPPVVSGSGIRTAATFGDSPGNVFLFAPKGVVNAGEAGIGGTNVTISATAVLGANNIQVGGIGTGVPVASTGNLAAGLTGVSNLNASVNQAAQSASDMSKKNSEANQDVKLSTLSVDVLGFGVSNPSQDEDEKRRKAKSAS